MRVPILTYHAANVAGAGYVGNDHVALAADLEALHARGWRVRPLAELVAALDAPGADLGRCIALSCDDGTDYDYRDLDYPGQGPQRSFFNILRDFQRRHGEAAQPGLHMTSFVIADAQARQQIDQHCLGGHGRIGDDWWRPAAASGLMAIGNHSFDHNHGCLGEFAKNGLRRGDFHAVDRAQWAEYEIAGAQALLAGHLGAPPDLFCYPFGHAPDYLSREWLPQNGPRIGLRAAFGDGARPATSADDRWNLPRYVCGWHWRTPADFEGLLAEWERAA